MLNRLSLIFLLLVSVTAGTVLGQSGNQVLNQLKSSILSADAVGLAEQTMHSVEIALFGEGRYYSRGQATLLLKGFFKDYPPQNFKIVSTTRTPGAWFIEGVYSTKKSSSDLRIYIRLRIAQGTWRVREFLVEESNE